ncbi:hypothetical protein BCV69DRAFT_296881 [Microstroma glucosiphilum]|uniref:Uncharacterized protein n=1 Tax=Pseudomicrostroma glucosiphilum TaxID=1684307 RepID=A0A316UG76_9BASI|nr:hypothetical protein BCV69DRAFT_296881 [Pseudomicrostroma glucosiphilum]PWN22913.1 hypothetical protein BCV69DRAFT_296881 [Pseudomicrostroma glucosiphilum]
MVRFLNSFLAVGILAVAGLVQAAPFADSDMSQVSADVLERNVEMAVGRDGLDVMEDSFDLLAREVINCKITYPTKKTKWTAGEDVKVTWDPSCVKKAKYSKYTGQVLLGYKVAGKSSYHLRSNHPLADDFLLKNGSVDFTLPANLTTRSEYFVVLMGDSGNRSPMFTINSA